MVGLRQLFPADLTDEHLTMLNRAIRSTSEATVEGWLTLFVKGTMRLYEFTDGPVGMIGLMKRTEPECIWVELMTGKGLCRVAKQILGAIRSLEEVGSLPVVMLVPDQRLEKLYAWRGAKRLGTLMRYSGDCNG